MLSHKVQESPRANPGLFNGYVMVTVASFIMVAIWGTYYTFEVFFKPVLSRVWLDQEALRKESLCLGELPFQKADEVVIQ